MTAEIVAVGTELLLGDTVDTNSAELGKVLAQLGVSHTHRQTVGDNLERLSEALKLALSRSDIVFTIGGLGPTQDDLTREGIASALEDELVLDEQVLQGVRDKLSTRRVPFVPSQKRQAYRPACAETIENDNGTAPGLVCRKDGKTVIALPGPTLEFMPMLQGPVRRLLAEIGDGSVIHSRTLKIVGLGESMVEQKLGDLMSSERPTVAPYAKLGEVHLRLTAQAASVEEAREIIAPVEARIRERLGDAVFGGDEDTLEAVVLQLLRDRAERLAVAESCTGGGLGARVTSVPGASDVFEGGVVSYSDHVKSSLLGVREQTLAEHGAVSEQCAAEMAEGCKKATGAEWGVSITGVAGPDGGTADKPVGLVYIGVSGPDGTVVERHIFPGTREAVRNRSVQQALTALRARLMASTT
ncbi:MAG: competence/damage-inducible protein A [Armatimonadetes bacterium]|nr:competence/damage-inducible protein A [Armatimonadota bacterium]